MKRKVILLALVAFFLLAGSALAMYSAHYRLDWYTPLTGGGGGAANSTHYNTNFTVGQTAIGIASSTNYWSCLGYWCRVRGRAVYLPQVLRNAS